MVADALNQNDGAGRRGRAWPDTPAARYNLAMRSTSSTGAVRTRPREEAVLAALAAGVLGAVAGLVAFGLLTDALDSFATAAVLICAPVVLTCVLFARLPETRGLELEQSAPD